MLTDGKSSFSNEISAAINEQRTRSATKKKNKLTVAIQTLNEGQAL
jgi:hypothetical protein